jgi:hypothetical protein
VLCDDVNCSDSNALLYLNYAIPIINPWSMNRVPFIPVLL